MYLQSIPIKSEHSGCLVHWKQSRKTRLCYKTCEGLLGFWEWEGWKTYPQGETSRYTWEQIASRKLLYCEDSNWGACESPCRVWPLRLAWGDAWMQVEVQSLYVIYSICLCLKGSSSLTHLCSCPSSRTRLWRKMQSQQSCLAQKHKLERHSPLSVK